MPKEKYLKRRRNDFSRKPATRKLLPKILILTEGSKTEPLYFKEFCNYYGLYLVSVDKNENGITIDGSIGASPKTLYEHAKKIAKSKNNPYTEIYCVFDKDQHESFSDVVKIIKSLNETLYKKGITVKSITSVICFEIWFLLHFGYSSKGYATANELIQELKTKPHFKNYQKSQIKTFSLLKDKINTAKTNAKKLNAERLDDASTKVVDLIERLEDIVKIS